MKLILASKSVRRARLLRETGFDFEIVPSNYKENNKQDKKPYELVTLHALNKARVVAEKFSEGIVLGADTLVIANNKVLGQPKNLNEAMQMLKSLSKKQQEVITGIALIDAKTNKEFVDIDSTKLKFRALNAKEIDEYITNNKLSSNPVLGCAGAYAVQDIDRLGWVEYIEGSYSNVVGLPMEKLKELLKHFES